MAYVKKIKTRKLTKLTTLIGLDQLAILSKDASDNDTDRSKLIRDAIDQKYDIKLPEGQ